MGVSVHYWAVPPSSALFQRLERDKAFVTLMAALFPYGNGVFFFFNGLEADEREEILEDVIARAQKRLGPEPNARRLIEEFRQELERTRLEYPGVEHRCGSLEKTSHLVEERLREALKPIRSDAEKFVGKLLFGDRTLGAPDEEYIEALQQKGDYKALGEEMENTVGLVSAPLVQEGAQVLSGLEEEHLFINDCVGPFLSFQRWRRLYQDAAAGGEALLVGVC